MGAGQLTHFQPEPFPAEGYAVCPYFLYALAVKFREIGFLPDLPQGFFGCFFMLLPCFYGLDFQENPRLSGAMGEEGDIKAPVAAF